MGVSIIFFILDDDFRSVFKNSTHSVTIKFQNWRYYSNNTNAIYRELFGLARKNVYLYVCKFQLVWLMHMRIFF
jgi:hypothetical protein